MELTDLNTVLQSGGAPVAGIIVYFLWKLDKQMSKVLNSHDFLTDHILKSQKVDNE